MPRGLLRSRKIAHKLKKNPDLAEIAEVIDANTMSDDSSPNVRMRTARSLGRAILPLATNPEKTANSKKTTSSTKLTKTSTRSAKITNQLITQFSNPDATFLVATYQELITALTSKDADIKLLEITLGNNIIAEDNILINRDVTINFNGFSIISNDSRTSARVLDIRSGIVTLTGQGKIFAMGKNSVAIRAFGAISSGVPNYTTITIDEGISLFAPDSYGILISPNLGVAYGLTLDIFGQIFAHDGICLSSGVRGYDLAAPVINLKPSAQIIADELSGAAIESAGYGKWYLTESYLHSAIGASLSSGILNLDHAKIAAIHGECFRILESADNLLEVSITGGNYASAETSVIAGAPDTIKKFEVKSCNFYSNNDMIARPVLDHIKTKKVTFRTDVQTFLDNLSTKTPVPEETPTSQKLDAPITPGNTAPAQAATTVPNPSRAANQVADQETTTSELIDDLDESMIDWIGDESIEDLESEFEDLLIAEAEPRKKSKKLSRSESHPKLRSESRSKSKASKTSKVKPAKTKTRKKPSLTTVFTELTDDATDEQEILATLAAEDPDSVVATSSESTAPTKPTRTPNLITPQKTTTSLELAPAPQAPTPSAPTQLLAPAPAPTIPLFTNEQDAARRALFDAITDIRKLSAEDYDTGFTELEQVIQQAEQLLRNPLASLSDICDAASTLLRAFDDLEERDDAASMSDEELDELFYHGAVLQEMLKESKKDKPTHHKKHAKVHAFLPESPKSALTGVPDLLEVVEKRRAARDSVQNFPQPQVAPEFNPNFVPTFAELSAVLTRISEIDLNSYTLSSQETLLKTLSDAQSVLNDPSASQNSIDNLATKLSTEITQLIPLRQPYNNSAIYQAELNSPAPTLGNLPAPTMIDELAPASVWSLGVTMIDELTPFTTDPTTREKMLRAMQSQFYVFKKSLTKPFTKLAKSFTAGFRAGVHAYKETLHATGN